MLNIHIPLGLKKAIGLTLIELMVTIAVLAILTAIALPDLHTFVVRNRLATDVNGFVGLINYARSEAISRNQSVVICPKSNAAITCESTQFWGEFETQVFVDADGDGERDAAEVLLKTVPAVDTTASQRGFSRTGGAGRITFQSVGFSSTAQSFDIWAIKSGDTAYELKYGRRVCISKPGRVRVIAYLTTCTSF